MNELDPTQKALNTAIPFLEKIINPPLEEIGLLLQDRVKLWRLKQQLKIVNKAKELVEKHNISVKVVPLKILAPLLENASLEEDDQLQSMWARLLVNYVDSKQNLLSSVFPFILSQLSNREAGVLNVFMKHTSDLKTENIGFNKQVITKFKFNEEDDFKRFEIENLVRLGIIEFGNRNGYTEYFDHEFGCIVREGEDYNITVLGHEFLKACTLPE